MLHIQRMAEVVKEQGVFVQSFKNIGKDNEETKVHRSPTATEYFWRFFDDNHVFVFSPINETPEDLEIPNNKEFYDKDYEDFSEPFDVFSLEISGQDQAITVSRHEDYEQQVDIVCIMVAGNQSMASNVESNDGKFVYYHVKISDGKTTRDRVLMEVISKVGGCVEFPFREGPTILAITNILTKPIKALTDRLNQSSTIGVQDTFIKTQYRDRKNKPCAAYIKKIIHIVPKSKRDKYKSYNLRPVEWTHRFWRRGTWVNFYKEDGTIDMTKVGKNREGEYCVYGKTWRVETVVNQDREDLPMIQKTSIVKGATNEKNN